MNYYEPRQVDPTSDRPDAGKWRYTCMNDGRVWPVGYCGGTEIPEAERCPGHDDPQGAREHQTQYLLDTGMKLDGQWADEQHHCEFADCGAWTDRFAEIDMHTWNLCDAHRTREIVATLFGTVGDLISSY